MTVRRPRRAAWNAAQAAEDSDFAADCSEHTVGNTEQPWAMMLEFRGTVLHVKPRILGSSH